MPSLGTVWSLLPPLAAASNASNTVGPLRAWLAGWASGLDTLAGSAGAARPGNVVGPQSWDHAEQGTAAELTGSTPARRAIDAWESWYGPVATRLDLPPSTLIGDSVESEPSETWSQIRALVTSQPWAAFLSAEAGRWRDALGARAQLPPSAAERVTNAERAARAWWMARARRPFAGATPPVRQPPRPTPPTPTRRRRRGSSGSGLGFFATVGLIIGGGYLATRKR